MGKIDDMRRLREQQFADNDKRANDDKREVAKTATTKDPSTVTAPPAVAPRAAAAPKAKPSGAATADEGKCSVCGKMKALTNGLVASHQKGFGKACAGSRKEPA